MVNTPVIATCQSGVCTVEFRGLDNNALWKCKKSFHSTSATILPNDTGWNASKLSSLPTVLLLVIRKVLAGFVGRELTRFKSKLFTAALRTNSVLWDIRLFVEAPICPRQHRFLAFSAIYITFSHLADALIQSDVQRRKQSSNEQ